MSSASAEGYVSETVLYDTSGIAQLLIATVGELQTRQVQTANEVEAETEQAVEKPAVRVQGACGAVGNMMVEDFRVCARTVDGHVAIA